MAADRGAAYADLVAAVLDLRSPDATARFDDAVAAAVSAGSLTAELARHLRMLQREAERSLVEHAATVLPPALVALDRANDAHVTEPPVEPAPPESDPADAPAPHDPDPPADLTARRLLVAGLRPISHRGSLP